MAERKTGLKAGSDEGITVEMHRSYTDHFLCKQMRALIDEAVLRDTEVVFRPEGARVRVSAFMLSLTSPVFHKMVCGGFRESLHLQLELEDVKESAFEKILNLACGRDGNRVSDVGEVLELAKLADRFQMSDVVDTLEDVVLRLMSVDVCSTLLSASTGSGRTRVMEAGRALALSQFEEVAKSDGFMGLTEDTLGSLLDDDGLFALGEEKIFEALVRWMKGGKDGRRGQKLLKNIRFPLMDGLYLALKVRAALPEAECLKDLVMEACMVKVVPADARSKVELQHLTAKGFEPRLGKGVLWKQYLSSGERSLAGHSSSVSAVVECMGRICTASFDDTIKVWNRSTLESERTLRAPNGGADQGVWSLSMWEGHLISGHGNGRLIVWDVATRLILQNLDGHTNAVAALAVYGSRLVSASWDRKIKIWVMGTAAAWPCERTLAGHTGSVYALAVWEGRVLSGSLDKTIRVWDISTGVHQVTLDGFTNIVTALVVHGHRLIGSSWDGTIRVWALGTWEPLRIVQAYPPASRQQLYRLVLSGSKLVSGSADVNNMSDEDTQYEVRVWDLETFECEHTLRQPAGAEVYSLLALGGEVWAGVSKKVVVWGRA